MIDKKELIKDLIDCIIDATDSDTQITSLTMCALLMNEVLDEAFSLTDVVKRTLERKEAAYACVNMWYEKEYDSSTPDDEVASMDKEAAELNAQIKVLRHILSEVNEL